MKFFAVLLVFLGSCTLQAQVIDVLFEGISEKRLRTQARKEIMEKAIEEISLKYISGIIGEEKAKRNRKIIDNKIIKKSGKYILYMRGSPLKKTAQGIKMDVSLKISLDSLSKTLLANGLLYKMEGAPKILPMITIEDRVNISTYSWWQGNTENIYFLKKELASLHDQLRKSFDEKSFFVLLPIKHKYIKIMPKAFKIENPRMGDFLFLSEYFKAHIFVKGKIQYRKKDNFSDKIESVIVFTAYQVGNGRVIADVKRRYVTTGGEFKKVVQKNNRKVFETITKDLVSQVYSTWQKGTFGSSLIKITFNGKISYKKLILLKNKLSHLNEIREIRERLFAPDSVTFEVDASALPHELAKVIARLKLNHLSIELDDVSSNEIKLDVSTSL